MFYFKFEFFGKIYYSLVAFISIRNNMSSMSFDDEMKTPEEAAPEVAEYFEKERFLAAQMVLGDVRERGGKLRTMELVEKHFRDLGKFEIAAKCLPWLLEILKKEREMDSEIGNKTPDEIRDHFGLGKKM